MPVIESPKPHRRRPDAEQRIRQLLHKNKEQRLQLAYMQIITAQLMLLIPKKAVSDILDAAAKKFSQPTKGESNARARY